MPSKIIHSTPDRRHVGIYRITLAGGTERYRVYVPGIMDSIKFPRTREGYADAQDALQAAREAKAAGIKPVSSRQAITVAEVVRQFEIKLAEDVTLGYRAKGTVTNYANTLKYLVKIKGTEPMARLQATDLQEVVTMGRTTGIERSDGKPGRVWKPETHRLFKIVCDLLWDYAVEQRYATTNISRGGVRAPKQVSHQRYESDHWTTDEMAMLDRLITGDPMEIAFRLGLAGLRRGEVAGLRWTDVDLSREYPHMLIRNTRVDNDGAVEEKGTKSGKPREYPLGDPTLLAALKAEQKRQQRNRWKAGPIWRETGYVVVGPVGLPYTPDHITKAWRAFCINHEIRYIKFHGSRHSFATNAVNTTRPDAVQALLGHASLRTTGIYLHPDREALQAATGAAAARVQGAARRVPRRGPKLA